MTDGALAALPPGAVPPAVVGLTLWVCVERVLRELEVLVGEEMVVDAEVEVLEALTDGVTLEVVVSEEEETPADCVAVEPPPQPASRAVTRMARRLEAIRFVGIGRSAYPKGSHAATPDRRRF